MEILTHPAHQIKAERQENRTGTKLESLEEKNAAKNNFEVPVSEMELELGLELGKSQWR